MPFKTFLGRLKIKVTFEGASVRIRPGHNFLHLCMDFKII